MGTKETIEKLEVAVKLHEKMRNCYFFTPPAHSSLIRSYERYNSKETEIEYNGDKIKISQCTRCSFKNVYYTVSYYINGEPVNKDIRFIKRIIRELKQEMVEE